VSVSQLKLRSEIFDDNDDDNDDDNNNNNNNSKQPQTSQHYHREAPKYTDLKEQLLRI
jgi:hypothetical protein